MLHWWQILFKLGILGSLPQLRAKITIEHILLDCLHFLYKSKENPEAPNSTQPKFSAFLPIAGKAVLGHRLTASPKVCSQAFTQRKPERSYSGNPEGLKKINLGSRWHFSYAFRRLVCYCVHYYGAGHVFFNLFASFRCSLVQRKPIHHSLSQWN